METSPLPFTLQQFLDNFAAYNLAIWPSQALALGLGLLCIGLLLVRKPMASRIIALILALLWLATGIGYHLFFFTRINGAAYGFALLFLVQAGLFARAAYLGHRLHFGVKPGINLGLGVLLVVYAIVVYPFLSIELGHGFPLMPMFGVTPCPTVLFTWGMLLLTVKPVPRYFLAMPFLWSVIGGSAAFLLGMVQDWPLLIGGFLATLLLMREKPAPAPTR
jgi:hypothetical protein